ncbi:calsyntenin-2-like [Brienomyrus brachyistius]|uniref:calsyntenin-2-like n=1 Tax=Brienomyrus brachyistius TaxID=42636 RepID=UPI0020B199FA|nr:calsyntenin-2-like [Brienomyrus brachyistius]
MLRLRPVLVLVLGALGLHSVLAGKVNKHKPWIETSYHGVIVENLDTVLLDPPLVALDKDAPEPFAGGICAFRVLGQDIPFEAVVLNRTSGEGVLRARDPVDCETRREYSFSIQAYDCGTGDSAASRKKSHKATVHIQVDDVNEFPPVFGEPVYHAAVTEGKIYDSILQVEATDRDCSPQYSQICNYDIVTPGTPFAIDRNGNIRNTERLSYDKQRRYKIMVTAFDCGQQRARENALVRIDVKPACKPGWQGWNKRVDYEPGTGSKQLFPKMHLDTCDEPVSSVRATVELQTSHIGKGCDRETYSENSLQKLCGAASGSMDLLPAPSSTTNWTASLLTDSGRDSDLIFRFEGWQAANIPDLVVPQNLTDQFTIATWMKHGPSPGLRAEKETLLCNSDKTEMNRHHYALSVHNCRLVFLLRRDFTQGGTFRPAEFHWKLEQICDKEWHYYVINVESPRVALFVDGVSYEPYLVTDDWPIHPSQIDEQLTVGACWQGGEVNTPRFTQYFRGSLSGLTIRPGRIENQRVISCLQACKEGLDISSLESLGGGIKFHFNPAQSILVMEGDDLDSINAALSKVSYINSRQFPTPGLRRLHITTTAQCFGEDTCVSIPDVEAVLIVLPPAKPRITISGTGRLIAPVNDLQGPAGLPLFPDLHITSTVMPGDSDTTAPHASILEILHNLDYCDVLLVGEELNPQQESLQLLPGALLGKHLDVTNSSSGISIYGVDSMVHYEQVIRQVRYYHWNPEAIRDRKFRLTCSELNGRYTSNEFNLEVDVLQSAGYQQHIGHMAAQAPYLRAVQHPVMIHGPNMAHSTGPPPAATVVIVMCIAALVVIVVLGVYRIRAAQQDSSMNEEGRGKRGWTDWDDSALTITVNPMESVQEQQGAAEEEGEQDEEEEDGEDMEEDVTSTESEDSDDEEQGVARSPREGKRNGHVEWNNCTY